MAKEIKTLSDLTPDNKNFNKGTEHGGRLLGDSISRFGCGRSILVDKDGNIIAGNKTAEKCAELGIEKVRVVETSGDDLVVVQRNDIELDSDRGREMALADNVTSLKDLDLDLELIEDCLGDDVLDRWGLNVDEKPTSLLSKEEFKPIFYEPDEIPNIKLQDCIDVSKFEEKRKVIEDADLTDEQKGVLLWLAFRFVKIDFEMVANYYSFNANDAEKEVLRRLRCVLIDAGDVNGFIQDDILRINEIGDEDDE